MSFAKKLKPTITRQSVEELFPADNIVQKGQFQYFDEINAVLPNALVYAQNLYCLKIAQKNKHVTALICSPNLISEINRADIAVVVSDDPRKMFFEQYLVHAKKTLQLDSKCLGENCKIHPSAVVSKNTMIGDRVTIGSNAVIEDNVLIHNDVYIAPNVVIGAEGLITIRDDLGRLMTISHAGGVEVHQGCQILSGAVIAKSLFGQFTTIGQESQIGILTNIGHGAIIGDKNVISGNSVVAGRANLGDNVWMGTSSAIAQGLTIGHGAQIKMGSVVVSNVEDNQVVSGNFAVSHRLNMARYLEGKA